MAQVATSVCASVLCAMALCGVLPAAFGRHVHSTRLDMAQLSSAVDAAAVAQQRALRRAVANAAKSPVNFTLTTDILLTAPLPDLQLGASVSIIGKCKGRDGKPRSCSIDGARRHTLFTGDFGCHIYLQGLVIHSVFGNVHIGGCSFSARYVVFRDNVGPTGVVLTAQGPTQGTNKFFGCEFVNNTALFVNGGVFNVGSDPIGGPSLSFANCTFRKNRALIGSGGAIYAQGNTMIFRDVVFEGNSAVSGGAIMTSALYFTAIRTTFSANIAQNGHGGAIAVTWDRYVGTYKFCQSTFHHNVASLSRYRSSKNIAFFTGVLHGSVDFCPGPAPSGMLAPKLLSLERSCTGCSGCDGDCHGNGQCFLDPAYLFPSCQCTAFFQNESSCTECVQGYTRHSQCTECSPAYYHPLSKPKTCALCPGLSKILVDDYMVNSIYNFTSATGPQQCQKFCIKEKLPSSGTEYKYCNMWIYIPERMGSPATCAGKCFLLSQSEGCGVHPIQKSESYGIYYQYLEPNFNVCADY